MRFSHASGRSEGVSVVGSLERVRNEGRAGGLIWAKKRSPPLLGQAAFLTSLN